MTLKINTVHFAITEINDILEYIEMENSYFPFINIPHYCLTLFLIE